MFSLSYEGSEIRFTYPQQVYNTTRLKELLPAFEEVHKFSIDSAGSDAEILFLELIPTADKDEVLSRIFSAYNQVPCFIKPGIAPFHNHAEPLVSCIILLTANDLFTHRVLIPGIIASSSGTPIEIIIVYNGYDCDMSLFENFTVVESSFGCVARGYNQGVLHAKGHYVAIFHDDCVVNDKGWIRKAIAALDSGAAAATPEIIPASGAGLAIAKNVPLVMRKADITALGGYDEWYVAGIEDMDFTFLLQTKAKAIRLLDIDYHHFDGMSTTLMMSPEARVLKKMYSLNMLPKTYINRLKAELFGNMMFDISLVTAKNMSYFIEKYEGDLAANGFDALLQRKQHFLSIIEQNQDHPLVAGNQSFLEHYRSFLHNQQQ